MHRLWQGALTVRAQYHSREVDGHRLIWNVRRLVELAGDLPVVAVPLAEIRELDEPWWVGPDTPRPTCRAFALHAKLMAECDLAHPIILCADGGVMDWMHRVCKALNEGRTHVDAVRFPTTPEPDHVDVDLDELPYD